MAKKFSRCYVFSIMSLQTISLLLFAASISAYLNYRFLRLPPTIGIMAISLCFSLVMIGLGKSGVIDLSGVAAAVQQLDFNSLLLHGMLSFLLFAGALQIDLEDLHKDKGAVAVLSTVGVLLACLITGSLFWLFARWLNIEMPFLIALVFGAIISPTDPIAVLGILKQAGVSKRLQLTISAEALFNDGIGVVAFLTVSALAFEGHASLSSVGLALLREIAGGIGLGFILGWITYRLLRTVDSYSVEILMTLALAAGSYSLAERLHVSAPISTVIAGLIIGNRGRAFGMSPSTRDHLDTFWELIDEFLNAVLFMLIGFEIMVLTLNLSYIIMGVVSIVAVLLGRWFSVGLPISVMRKRKDFSPHTVKILTWGGLRGGISVALALSLPLFPQHDILIVATYITVLFSILVQGTSLQFLSTTTKQKTS